MNPFRPVHFRSTRAIAALFAAALSVTFSVALGGSLAAQNDAIQVVKKIATEIESEMKEIDRLLQQSARPAGGSSEAARETVGRSQESMEKVVRGIDRLIDELQKMSQQSQSRQQSGQPQDQQQDQQQGDPQEGDPQQQGQGRPQRGQGNRDEIQTPDIAEPQGQRPGEQPQPGEQQPGGQRPQGRQASDEPQQQKDPGANVRAGSPIESETERLDRPIEDGSWGDLQKYVPPDHLRAGVPEVPARYRRLWEAFQRRAQKTEPRR
ncbi:MAG: hypothetical protein HZB39_01405 [Planctomycetes bacterium]|nr:hypothetical protein [Planctomycetota bacterium]